MCTTHTHTTITIPSATTTTTTTPEKATTPPPPPPSPPPPPAATTTTLIKSTIFPIISRLHAGYFRITLSLCYQTLLWKTIVNPPNTAHAYRRMLAVIPYTTFILIWSLSLFTLISLSTLYILRCMLLSHMVKKEYLNHITVNYLFAPWISWLLLLQSSPFFTPYTTVYNNNNNNNNCYYYYYYYILWCVFVAPIIILDVKMYGQWLTKGKRLLSTVATPASQLTVIGNFVGARAAAEMGWREGGVVMFAVGVVHYVVVFVTLYQRLSGKSCMPEMLRPVMFLFVGAPSMGSLAWGSIAGEFDCLSKMMFYLSVFLFLSLVSRPNLFKKSMKKFNVVWWAYSFPLTVLALASVEYAQELKTSVAHLFMLILSALSVLVSFVLMFYTTLNTNILLPRDRDSEDEHHLDYVW